MSDNQIVWQIVVQVWNLGNSLAIHNNKDTNHSVIAVTCTTGFGVVHWDAAQIQIDEQFIVKFSFWLRNKKTDVFKNFLTIDKNHSPLWGFVYNYKFNTCACGGIGRRARLRIWCPRREGSSPFRRTIPSVLTELERFCMTLGFLLTF